CARTREPDRAGTADQSTLRAGMASKQQRCGPGHVPGASRPGAERRAAACGTPPGHAGRTTAATDREPPADLTTTGARAPGQPMDGQRPATSTSSVAQ